MDQHAPTGPARRPAPFSAGGSGGFYYDVLDSASPDTTVPWGDSPPHMQTLAGIRVLDLSQMMVSQPVRLHAAAPAAVRPAPLLGEHTEEVLRELGYSPATIGDLEAQHVIRCRPEPRP